MVRFYEEGDAASLVIPWDSEFRRNIDWLDENFPREVKTINMFVFLLLLFCNPNGFLCKIYLSTDPSAFRRLHRRKRAHTRGDLSDTGQKDNVFLP